MKKKKDTPKTFEMDAWVATWPKGTTEDWEGEDYTPRTMEPIHIEPAQKYLYFNKEEKRYVFGCTLALFGDKAEAKAWNKMDGGGWEIHPVHLTVRSTNPQGEKKTMAKKGGPAAGAKKGPKAPAKGKPGPMAR